MHSRPKIAPFARSPRPAPVRAGFALFEIALAVTLLIVGLGMFTQTFSTLSRFEPVNRETSIALRAARNTLESLRSVPLENVYATYNADRADDPGGAGTAPGDRFEVAEVGFELDGPGALTGRISFPERAGGIFEDIVDATLGMPRDLDGDGVIDADDHSGDYAILPVRVTITWGVQNPQRSLDLYTALTQ